MDAVEMLKEHNEPGRLSNTLLRLLMRRATVSDVERSAEGFRLMNMAIRICGFQLCRLSRPDPVFSGRCLGSAGMNS